ncbi:hypothetical protein F0562_001582 [Nyssa sinensis]|uniref:NAC domain-containing protein n=1 Tax=Nyssa sinensis TaxID=561372 RepID=A0A5J5C3P9_9ASTE|nr:hypothetical protein F0562_001582 [Nyssa sinensis]
MEEHPPGFRFYPTEEELISFYLHNKLEGKIQEMNLVIPVVDIYELEPWQLPELSGELCHGDPEQWFFFTPRQEREARGGRPNRTTASGYWKATGSPGYVYSSNNRVIGVKKTMVFYKGKAPTGRKTKWKMNEYRAIEEETATPSGFAIPKLRHELSLCRVYVVSGSFRAFDRRPLVAETRETITQQGHGHGHGAISSSENTPLIEKTSSPESSYSGEEPVELPGTNWETVNGLDPLWEWEQLNWL